MAIVGHHQIRYRKPKDAIIDRIDFNAQIEFAATDYSFESRFGTDKWVLYVGHALSHMTDLINDRTASDVTVRLFNLSVVAFNKGVMQWSGHEIETTFDYEVIRQGKVVSEGSASGRGAGNGTEFGAVTYIPILGNANFDKGIEVAMFRSLEAALLELNEKLSQ